jgi:protein gp37
MLLADWHIFQILTKRSQRLQELLNGDLRNLVEGKPHMWWGVSVENRKHGLPRIDHLRDTPAAVKFLSIEPLLEDLGTIRLRGIDWVIVGGESGAGARPMKEECVVSLRDLCRVAGVPFFFKQWGGVRKNEAGRLLEGKEHNEYPSLQHNSIASNAERKLRVAKVMSQD